MTINGIFMHRSEVATVPLATLAYAAVRLSIGELNDPNAATNWIKAGVNIKRMAYDSANSENSSDGTATTVFKQASKFVESLSFLQATQGQYWHENPVIVKIIDPLIDLMWVDSYVKYMWDTILRPGDPKMLLYTTAKKWNAIQVQTSAGEKIASDILNRAELMVSEYGIIANPSPCAHVGVIRFWEWKTGMFEFKADGRFNHSVEVIPSVGEGNDTPVGEGGFIHMKCPKCGQVIF